MKLKKKNITGALVGGLIGGAGNAVYDGYIKPMLPADIEEYGEYVKVAIGVALPMLAKNDIVAGIGSGLVTVGCSNIVSSLINGTTTSGSGDGDGDKTSGIFGDPARVMIGSARRPNFNKYIQSVKRKSGVHGVAADPASAMVSGTKVVC